MVTSVERLHIHSDSVLRDHSTSHQHRKRAPTGSNSSKHLQHDDNPIQLVSHCPENCDCISCRKTKKRCGTQRNRRRRNWSNMPFGETKWLYPLYKQAFYATPHRLLLWHRKLAYLSSRFDVLRFFYLLYWCRCRYRSVFYNPESFCSLYS